MTRRRGSRRPPAASTSIQRPGVLCEDHADALRLRLRRAGSRRPRAARRQGRRARGDDRARRSRSCRLHDHDRCLPRLHGRRQAGARGARRRGGHAHRRARGALGEALRRPVRPAARLCSLGRGDLDAGDDGHDPQPRPHRRRGRGPGGVDREPALRLRLVPAADPDVRRGRRRRRRAAIRGCDRRPQGAGAASRTISSSAPTICAS